MFAHRGEHIFGGEDGGAYVVGLAASGGLDKSVQAEHLAASVVAGGICSVEVLAVAAERLAPVTRFTRPHGEDAPTECSFLSRNPAMIITSGMDGAVRLWDVRTASDDPARTLRPSMPGSPIYCASVNSDDELCAISTGSLLTCLDMRSSKEVFRHEEAHSDTVTCLAFRPSHSQELASSGDDGLTCVIDVARCIQGGKAIEDDAGLRIVLNSAESTRHMTFIGEKADALATISTTEILQLWSVHEERPGASCGRFERLRESPSLKVDDSGSYVVDVLYDQLSGRAHAIVGSVNGSLGLFHLNLEGAMLRGRINAAGVGHSEVVRGLAQLGGSEGLMATGGEDGKVCLWAPGRHADGPASEQGRTGIPDDSAVAPGRGAAPRKKTKKKVT